MANNNRQPRNGGSQNSQIREIAELLKAAADMQKTSGQRVDNLAAEMAKVPSFIQAAVDSIADTVGGGGSGMGGVGRPGFSGTSGSRPRARDNQTAKPFHGSGVHPSYSAGVSGAPDQLPGRHLGLGAYQAHQQQGGMAGLRNYAQNGIANAVHSRFGAGSGSTFLPVRGSNGQISHIAEYNQAGTQVASHMPGSPLGEAGMKAAGTRAGISGIAGAFGEGGAMAAVRAVPYVGEAAMAVGAAYEGVQQFGQQRAANAQYQSIYGGSNLAGMGQRVQGEGFKIGQELSGGLTGQMATQAFQGVSALGQSGRQRGNSLDFIQNNYKSMGMDVQSSLQLVQVAAKNFGVSLTGLTSNLKQVTAAAKEAGQNAAQLRANMIAGTTAASNEGLGINSAGFATGLTNAATGNEYSDVNYNALNNPNSIQQMATAAGMSYGQFMGQASTQVGLLATGAGNLQSRAFTAAIGSNMNAIKQAITQAGGAKTVGGSNAMQQQIATQLMSQNMFPNPNSTINTLNQYLGPNTFSTANFKEAIGQIVAWVANSQMGGGGATGNLSASINSSAQNEQTTGLSSQKAASLRSSLGQQNSSNRVGSGSYDSSGYSGSNPVAQWELNTNQSSTTLEQTQKLLGANGKVTVNGKTKSLKDALSDPAFVQAMQAGTAVIASGKQSGSTLASQGISESINSATGTNNPDGSVTTANGVVVSLNISAEVAKKLGIKLSAVSPGTSPAQIGTGK